MRHWITLCKTCYKRIPITVIHSMDRLSFSDERNVAPSGGACGACMRWLSSKRKSWKHLKDDKRIKEVSD